jgi:hypothetical protein
MNLTKFFRKNSKWLVGVTIGAFIITTLIGLISSYASLFFK